MLMSVYLQLEYTVKQDANKEDYPMSFHLRFVKFGKVWHYIGFY